MSICLYASSLYNICYVSLRHSPELEECTPNPDHYLLAHITIVVVAVLVYIAITTKSCFELASTPSQLVYYSYGSILVGIVLT
jgi:hypothetical protein